MSKYKKFNPEEVRRVLPAYKNARLPEKRKYGFLYPLKPSRTDRWFLYFIFQCDCGNITEKRLTNVFCGDATSCGCGDGIPRVEMFDKNEVKKQFPYYVDGRLPENKKYGSLTPIKLTKHDIPKGGNSRFLYGLFRCDCGNEKEYRIVLVLNGTVKSCGQSCSMKKPNKYLRSKTPQISSWRNRYTNKIIGRGRDKDIPVNLTLDEYIEVCSQNCFYCNAKPQRYNLQDMVSHHVEHFSKSEIEVYTIYCNGTDRISNNEGYTIENVVPCCQNCNFIKFTQDNESFKKMVKQIYLNRCS